MDGFIQLHKKILESYVFTSERDLKIWIWLLLKARFKKGFAEIKIGKAQRTLELKRGQLIFGRHKAEEALGIPGNTIVRHLEKMKEQKMILIDVGSQYSIITICNYDSYQTKENESGQPMGRQWAGNGQPMGTKKEDNKDKEDNSLSAAPSDPEKKENEILKRKAKFITELKAYSETYSKDMLNAFYKYWVEMNKSGTKMRYELEKTWETKRRLETWASREPVKAKVFKINSDQDLPNGDKVAAKYD